MCRRGRAVAVGLTLVFAYLASMAVTAALHGDDARPLYDGVTPAPSYRWVSPPAFFAAGNAQPAGTSDTIALGADGSTAAGITTPDGQFVLNLGRGAVAPRDGARRVRVAITPVDPSRLTPVPEPRRANGNAYRVVLTYQPIGTPVTRLAHPGTLALQVPEVGDATFRSTRGVHWARIAAQPVPPRNLSLTASFDRPGYFLGATKLPELSGAGSGSSNRSVVLALGVGALALLVVAGGVLLARRARAT